MCGFVGVFGDEAREMNKVLAQGARAIWHRGPDASGAWDDERFSIRFNRLKIIDLSDEANQPFEDDRFVLAFNGEIYNYIELKRTLNVPWRTNSDTEVLFEVLKRYRGDLKQGLSLLDGMFAFAFYDKEEKRLIVGRDRLGVKPLYYAEHSGMFFFGSEIKALRDGIGSLRPNHRVVVNFLTDRTLDYNKETFFEGVFQVEPGALLVVEAGEKMYTPRQERYWNAADLGKRIQRSSEKEQIEEFRALFFDAVKIRLRSDVPVAVLLSGGLDSSAITAVMASMDPKREVTAVSAVYPGSPFDERVYAEAVIQERKNIKPLWVAIDESKFFPAIERVVEHEETPLADGSMVAHFLLMEEIHKRGIKVVLTGQGGDEILGGYIHTFLPAYDAEMLRHLRIDHFSKRAIFHALPATLKNVLRKWIDTDAKGRFFKDDHVLKNVRRFYRHYPGRSILSSYLIQSLRYWSLPGFLHYDDRNAMAFSIETRGPFLDYRLVEYMLSLPDKMKIRNRSGKWILKKALGDIIPRKVVERPDKQGFYAPIDQWNETIPLDFLNDSGFGEMFPYLNLPAICKDATMKWRVYTLYLWYRGFLLPTEIDKGR